MFIVQDIRRLAGIGGGNQPLGDFTRHQPGSALGRTTVACTEFASGKQLDNTGSSGVNFLGE